MARALIDTTVLFAAAYRRDGNHADALPILQGIDDGSLPDTVVLNYILGETLDGLTTHAGHEAAVDFLDRIEGNTRFHVESLDANTFAAGKSLFRERRRLSFVDACLVVYAQAEEIRYLYALDDDFDGFDDVSRLETTTNPYDPR